MYKYVHMKNDRRLTMSSEHEHNSSYIREDSGMDEGTDTYYYGHTIKEYRERRGWTQAKLAQLWPRKGGDVGVSTRYVQDIEAGNKPIANIDTLRKLCELLDIPYWKMGLSEYDPLHPEAFPRNRTFMYDETLHTAEGLIKRTWNLRRMAPLAYVEEAVNDLNRLFDYLMENIPPPLRLEQRYQVLYAQLLRLNAVLNVEKQRYQEALAKFKEMHTVAVASQHPATIAISLLGTGTELERAGKQKDAIACLEEARDESFRASKPVAAFVNAYLARVYAGDHQAAPFKRAIDIAQRIATDIKTSYGDGTDFVFHSISGVMAERSYGYLEIYEPQSTLDMREEIKRQIALEGNRWLDAWIPLDWARAYLMLGNIEQSVEEARTFYHKAQALKSPHAVSRAVWMLNTYKAAGYGDAPSVKEYEHEIEQVAQLYPNLQAKFTL
jgi:transcriptional regulator with XRE-family HTH domain